MKLCIGVKTEVGLADVSGASALFCKLGWTSRGRSRCGEASDPEEYYNLCSVIFKPQ